MSAEFYENMEKMKEIIDRVKFLEGSHPQIHDKFLPKSEKLISVIQKFENEVLEHLKNIYSSKELKNKIKSLKKKR